MNLEPVLARSVLANIERTTPGGIRAEQFIRRRHPIKTALAALPFIALAGLLAFAALMHS